MLESVVILALAALSLTGGTALDRGEIIHRAGCLDVPVISIIEDPERGYTAIVRCRVRTTPTAEILRSDPWEPARQIPDPLRSVSKQGGG